MGRCPSSHITSRTRSGETSSRPSGDRGSLEEETLTSLGELGKLHGQRDIRRGPGRMGTVPVVDSGSAISGRECGLDESSPSEQGDPRCGQGSGGRGARKAVGAEARKGT